jgi:hypothetical protein
MIENGKKSEIVEVGKVIEDNSRAVLLLPTWDGFFFGNTDYNEWYYNDVVDTIKIIEKALTLDDKWNFYYHSSW